MRYAGGRTSGGASSMNRIGFVVLALGIAVLAVFAWGAYAVQAPTAGGQAPLPGLQRLRDGLADGHAAFRASLAEQMTAQSGAWVTLAPQIEPRQEMAVAELNGRIYAIGGFR